MSRCYVRDTHPLLWFLAGDKRLGREALRILEADDATLIVPATVVVNPKDDHHLASRMDHLGITMAYAAADRR